MRESNKRMAKALKEMAVRILSGKGSQRQYWNDIRKGRK